MGEKEGHKDFTIRRAKLDSLDLYEITADELDVLEKGGPGSIYLNFLTFCFSTFLSFVVAVFSTEKSDLVLAVFIAVLFSSFVMGVYFSILWIRSKMSQSSVSERIRARMAVKTPSSGEGDEPNGTSESSTEGEGEDSHA